MKVTIKMKIIVMGVLAALTPVLILLAIINYEKDNLSKNVEDQLKENLNDSLTSISRDIVTMLKSQHELLLKVVNSNLKVAENMIKKNGGVRLLPETVQWESTNQVSKEKNNVTLPKMALGSASGPIWFGRNYDPKINTPVVDEVSGLVGGVCTIFQKMNDKGDMLRIATNVLTKDNNKAIGTYIPALNQDGTKNAIIETVLAGGTYTGRAVVVDSWYVTAYSPLLDDSNRVIGMCFVGVKQESVQSLRKSIMDIKAGKTGYAFVLGGTGEHRGSYIISAGGRSDGEKVWDSTDADGKFFVQNMINSSMEKSKKGQIHFEGYSWKNPGDPKPRHKTAACVYFEPWDWVVGVGTYTDEFMESVEKVNASIASLYADSIKVGAMTLILAILIAVLISIGISRNINALVVESGKLSEAVESGDLSVRGDPSKVNFEFAPVIGGMNMIMDSFIKPLNVSSEYINKISIGMIPPKITDEYKGKFNETKVSLNTCIDSFNQLINDVNFLSNAAVEGKLSVRADASKHKGDFCKIVQGVNGTLDSVIGPLNMAAEYVDRISKGDIPPKVTDNYNGDFNIIKDNLNQCIDGLGGLIEANRVLNRMSVNDYSINVTGNYHGIFAQVAKAVNQVQEIIKHIASSIINISGGDLAELPAYKQLGNGTGKKSKNDILFPAMIHLMENLLELVNDSNMLSKTAVEGKLETRADVTKHQGDFRKIVEGINATLDAVVGPVREARECLEEMSKGNLDVAVTGDYKGDHAILKNALNSTLDSINDILAQIATAVDQVNSGALQVSDASQSLSESSTEAASSLEQVSASMQEVNAQTKQNAENAAKANQLSTQAKNSAETGNNQMKQMLEAMSDINESASNISKIIKAIDEIAFQTNLLALNAAVEAARAGKHGKGFTVVAGEVRNLAQRSAKAAKETTEMIGNSIKKTEAGTRIADDTFRALEEIVTGAAKVTDLIGLIATASREQAQAVLQINQGLAQVDQVTQQNTATAEESASASEQLSSQAVQLKAMLNRFKLRRHEKIVNSYVGSGSAAKREIMSLTGLVGAVNVRALEKR